MSESIVVFAGITSLFVLLLIVKSLSKKKFCVLCVASFTTWVSLAVLYNMGIFKDLLLIAPLIGSSAGGIYYLVEKRTKPLLHIFRLPFFLTLIFLSYTVLGALNNYLEVILFLSVLWMLFGIIYLFRENPKIKKAADKIIACCRDW